MGEAVVKCNARVQHRRSERRRRRQKISRKDRIWLLHVCPVELVGLTVSKLY